MNKQIKLSLSVVGILYLLTIVADGTIYYVNSSWPGSDLNNGLADTSTNAWLTISKCTSTLIAGDTCNIMGGTNYSSGILQPSNVGTAENRITLQGFNNAITVGDKSNSFLYFSGGDNYWNVKDLRIEKYGIDGAVYIEDSNNINLTGLILFNNSGNNGAGIKLRCVDYADVINQILIENISIENPPLIETDDQLLKIQVSNGSVRNVTIRNSTFINGTHNCLDIHVGGVASNTGEIRDLIIENNTISYCSYQAGIGLHDNNVSAIIRHNVLNGANLVRGGDLIGITLIGTEDTYIYNNEIYNWTAGGIYILKDGISYDPIEIFGLTHIYNNNIYGAPSAGYAQVGLKRNASGVLFENNTVYDSSDNRMDYYFEYADIANQNNTIRNTAVNSTVDNLIIRVAVGETAYLEYTDGRIFTENSVDIPFWYNDRSNITITPATVTISPKNSTLNTTGNITVSAFSSSAMTLDYYSQNVTRTNFTLSSLDNPSSFDISINNPASTTTNYTLYYWNGTSILINQSGSPVVFDSNLDAGVYYIEEGYTEAPPPTVCSGFKDGNTIYTGNCSSISELNTSINNVSVLQSSGDEWLLNANLTINASQVFHINDSDVSWLKLNSTYVNPTISAWRILVLGTLYINNTKVTSWNTTTSSVESLNELKYDSTRGRMYIYNSGASSHIYINSSNVSYLGAWCNNAFVGTGLCGGLTFQNSNNNLIINSTLLHNYIIIAQQSATNLTIQDSVFISKYAGIFGKANYMNVINNTITYSPIQAHDTGEGAASSNFNAITLSGNDYNNVSYNIIDQTSNWTNQANAGVRLLSNADNNTLIGNSISSDSNSALYLYGASYNSIRDCTFTKHSPPSAGQAPIQLELGTQNYNTFDNISVTTNVSYRAIWLSGNHTSIKNSNITNTFSGAVTGLRFESGTNLTIENTTISSIHSRDFEINADNGTAYIYDVFPSDFGSDSNNATINMVNSSNNALKSMGIGSLHYPTNSTFSYYGVTNQTSNNITVYSNLLLFATNSTILVNDNYGTNFTVTNNVGTVNIVNYSNITNGWTYYLNKDSNLTITSAVANGGKVAFTGLALADGIYEIANNSISYPPNITSWYPTTPFSDYIGTQREFNLTANQSVNVTWLINGTAVQYNSTPSLISNYTNLSAVEGVWNVTAIANNSNGTDSQEWTWTVLNQYITYVPPTPINISYTNGSTWVNHTWNNGTGNITNSYNVTHNGTWTNDTINSYYNVTVGYNTWSNITIYAYNSSGGGTLNNTGASQNVKTPEESFLQSTITVSANSWGMFNNWTTYNTTFSQISANESNLVACSYYNVSTGLWESYYPGYSYNSGYIISMNNSIMCYFNASTTIIANILTPRSMSLSEGWNMLYLEGTLNRTLSEIKTDIGNATDVWRYNSTSNTFSNTSTDSIQPNQGFLAYINQSMTWTRSIL